VYGYVWDTYAQKGSSIVRSHIGNERPKPGPYKCMLTLTSKTRFGVMCGCQEQNREGDLGGSPGFGWTERPKADKYLASEVGCYIWYQSRGRLVLR
jgi:hypothetical protein